MAKTEEERRAEKAMAKVTNLLKRGVITPVYHNDPNPCEIRGD